ncbi:hypothetical protein [Phytoactinopolyspora limicola]|uniref:hypothetical protein n=1 Tax=Phytoactinopolyspora limicola TaxID=2715536 RepID=UPI00140E3F30|nr:hypothetical protein [Phytoactinopolyspora limicola]
MRSRANRMRHTMVRVFVLGLLMLGIVAMHHLGGPASSDSAEASTSTVAAANHSLAHAGHAAGQHSAPTHQVDIEGSDAAGASHSGADHDASHHLLHLCLAVLTAAVLAVGLWLLVARVRMWSIPRPGTLIRQGIPRPPPRRRHGFVLLLSLCVIRV